MSTLNKAKTIYVQLKKLWSHIHRDQKNNFYILFGLTLLTSAIEILSLSLISPFMVALTKPEDLQKLEVVVKFSKVIGVDSNIDVVIFIVSLFGLTALMANGMRLLLIWVGLKAANATGAEISTEVFKRTLYQPYAIQTTINSSEIVGSITLKSGLATGVLIATAGMLTSLIIFSAFLIAILAIDVKVALVAISIFGLAYFSIGMSTRSKLRLNSLSIAKLQVQSIKLIQESLGAIRDITLDSTQKIYCDAYRSTVWPLQMAGSWNTFIGSCPRFIMEALGMVLVAILTLLLYKSYTFTTILPMLGTLAVAANRMLPLMQQIYGNWASINGSIGPLNDVIDLLNQPLPHWIDESLPPPLPLTCSISFQNVGFKYTKDAPWVLIGVNLTILKGSCTGFIGVTGSGKSTLLDLFMGLLEPTSGKILVDGRLINSESLPAWRQTVAHVPQSIYLSDSTIMENIAFGVPKNHINYERVCQAARQAQISEFIESRPDGYEAIVGERGIRLSGGQKQRIGIARALYKQATVLVFDEATSALDNKMEQSVMEAIGSLNPELTILIIAHRVSTLKNCNQIIELDGGKIKQLGAYDDIIQKIQINELK